VFCFLCYNSQALHRALLLGLTQPSCSQPLTRPVTRLCFFTVSLSILALSLSLAQSSGSASRSHSAFSLLVSRSLWQRTSANISPIISTDYAFTRLCTYAYLYKLYLCSVGWLAGSQSGVSYLVLVNKVLLS